MDLRYYFTIIFRRYKTILSIVALFLVISFIVTTRFLQPKSGALIFISVGVERLPDLDKENYNPREAVDAADSFSETIQGWLKDPVLIARMEKAVGLNLNVSARKQEKQNLILDITTTDINWKAEEGGAQVLQVLQDQVKTYNQATQSSFKIALNSINPYISRPNFKLNVLIAMVFGLFFGIFFVYIDEYLRGVVSFTSQAETILETKSFASISRSFSAQEQGLLASFLNSLGNKIIMAGVGMDSGSLVLMLVRTMAKYGLSNVALLDFDLKKRGLHRLADLSDEKLLGVTDLTAQTISSIGDYFRPIGQRVTFLSAGQGSNFSLDFVDWVTQVVPKVVIHSTLPDNPEVLSLPATDLVLLVQLGVTKEKDLEQIKMIFKGKVRLVVVG